MMAAWHMPGLDQRPRGRPSAPCEPTWRQLGQVLEHEVQVLSARFLVVIHQEGQGKDDVML